VDFMRRVPLQAAAPPGRRHVGVTDAAQEGRHASTVTGAVLLVRASARTITGIAIKQLQRSAALIRVLAQRTQPVVGQGAANPAPHVWQEPALAGYLG